MAECQSSRAQWFSRRSLVAHLGIVIWFPGCLVAGWWQATVAMNGNALSYLYAVEWPAFAIFGLVFWWNLVHDDPNSYGRRALQRIRRESASKVGDGQTPTSFRVADEDEQLAAYNDYLEGLAERNVRKSWRN